VSYLLFDLVVLVLPVAVLLRLSGGLAPRCWRAVAVLVAVALSWTAPWDEHLVRTGVWSYGEDRVIATLGSVPVEEYAFVALLVLLVAAWGSVLGLLPADVPHPGPPHVAGRARARGALAWIAVALAGTGMLAAGGSWRYLGLLLVWAGPPLALQRAVAGDLLRARSSGRLALAVPVALWLCLADRLALADGVWVIAGPSSTGLAVLGLPVEEALFFALVVLLVTDGLVLATDDRALRRARRPLAAVRARRTVGS
jgi:lycopene beta-cyclase